MQTKKVALITGANRGIGFETAKQLGEKGVTVVLAARQLAAAQQAATQLQTAGLDAHGIQLDVTNAAERTAAAQYLTDNFGQLDILVNNAGVMPAEGALVPRTSDTTVEELRYIFETNLFAVVALTHEVLPLLRRSPAGRIVNLSSVVASLGMQSQPNSPLAGFRVLSYNASKASLNIFTIQLAAELAGTNIKVNSAHPGWVKTEMGGGEAAQMEIVDGAKTSVELALLEADGPTGYFLHAGQVLPW